MRKYIILLLMAALIVSAAAPAMAGVNLPSFVTSTTTRLPATISYIEDEAFLGDSKITTLLIPDGIREIGTGAFMGCEKLTKICILSEDVVLKPYCLGLGNGTKEIWSVRNSSAKAYAEEYGFVYKRITDSTDLINYGKSLLGTPYGSFSYTKIENANGSYTYKYNKLDCVFFVYVCYRDIFGTILPDSCSRMQNLSSNKPALNAEKITSINDLVPGDIICWSSYMPNLTSDTYKSRFKSWYQAWKNGTTADFAKSTSCTHVGLYIGNYQFIDASSSGGKVQYGKFNMGNISSSYADWYVRNFMWAWRIL